MNSLVEYRLNKASEAEIAEHLSLCDNDFVPPLTGRVEIDDYAKKIVSKAATLEAWCGQKVVGLAALYCNDQESRIAYITNVSVLREWTGKGIASHLMNQCIEHAEMSGMRQLSLKVGNNNTPAIKLYEKNGFVTVGKAHEQFISMNRYLNRKEDGNSENDCNFDFDDGAVL